MPILCPRPILFIGFIGLVGHKKWEYIIKTHSHHAIKH
jgi:hypothetical protein